MPLASPTIITEVRKIADPAHPDHAWPTSTANAKTRWGAAVRAYFDGLAAPVLVPGTLDAAEVALEAAFNPDLGLPGLEVGLAAFAAVIVAGIGPGLIATPPAAPPSWGTLTVTNDGTARCTQLATAIDTWARTGLAGALPGPPALPWS